MWTYNYTTSTELCHHGIKGQKWGVRRTSAQLGRKASRKLSKAQKAKDKTEKDKRVKASKNRRNLSDAELKKKVERLKMEKEFKSLTDSDVNPGKKAASEILTSAGTKVLTAAVAGAAAYAVKAAMNKKFDIKEAAAFIVPNPNKKK